MKRLEGLKCWNSKLTKKARSALEWNTQITEAWGVQQRLETFLTNMEKVS